MKEASQRRMASDDQYIVFYRSKKEKEKKDRIYLISFFGMRGPFSRYYYFYDAHHLCQPKTKIVIVCRYLSPDNVIV